MDCARLSIRLVSYLRAVAFMLPTELTTLRKVSVPANNGSENTASESSGSSDAKTAKAESQNGSSEKNSTPAKEKSTTTT